ncbi:MAG TPA: guanitoxin biosynthesis L-enduracididine beta-hydroxylase GntD [Thermoanaerobaculia bacterium]|jgi:Fe(II)/alpha-ketoglutarate-dependent arginine beta-hydroxylase|nr:guanitoxin biosynthesis L-enduracididine beta-hydroxylase GntD [Thermoanaerobaculia bacterium]
MALITEPVPAGTAASLNRFVLDGDEVVAIKKLVDEIAAKFDSVEDPELLSHAPVWAQELPRRLRAALVEFRLTEPDTAHLIISGFPIDEEEIGPTPVHWNRPDEKHSPALAYEIFLVLASSLLGEPIGWKTQQAGRIVHDVMPIKGMEQEQIGTGSEMTITWHTEDAFHPMRGDYLGMLCLRNPDSVPTTFCSLENLKLSPQDWETLFEPHYTIKPDNSHQQENAAPEDDDELQQVYRRIEQMKRHPDKIALLSGDPRSPYIRIDYYFMDPIEDNPRAQQALEALIKAVDEQIGDLLLQPGDICFIDNFKAVHGRRAFKARYDGNDRWMKRINITRDLRKSRAERSGAASRIIQ